MIVVAIIGILAAIAVPKFAELIRKSNEGKSKGQLAALRSALAIYYAENEGNYPDGGAKALGSPVLTTALAPKYINAVPQAAMPDYHAASNSVYSHETTSGHNHDQGMWGYDGVSNPALDSDHGKLWIMCTHTDTKGSLWSAY